MRSASRSGGRRLLWGCADRVWLMVCRAGAALRRAGLTRSLLHRQMLWRVRNGLEPWGGGYALFRRAHSSTEGCGEAASCWPSPSAPARVLLSRRRAGVARGHGSHPLPSPAAENRSSVSPAVLWEFEGSRKGHRHLNHGAQPIAGRGDGRGAGSSQLGFGCV